MTANRNAIQDVARRVREIVNWQRLPDRAKAEHKADLAGLSPHDPGILRARDEAVGWLCRAQDHSTSSDGGVASDFSLVNGWGPSYPETTGYIVPTLLEYSRSSGDCGVRERAKRMLDWLTAIQFPEGGFLGGRVSSEPRVPVTFNTGQILLGLAAGVREFGDYQESLVRAADWLVANQDPDGAWRKHSSPFAAPREKTYDTHIAWGLLEAARIAPEKPYAETALANVRWALCFQRENGWIDNCCVSDRTQPLTHTIGYALRGIIEAYRFSNDPRFRQASIKTADALRTVMRDDGFIPGRLDASWAGTVPWACLTGTAQISICWLILYQMSGDPRYLESARTANRYLRRTLKVDGRPETRGGVKGSFPVSGEYGRFQYLNWACKFFIDANTLESQFAGA